ncbi:pyridoxal-phosphate dependent enzyme [Candidatus Peregrinibacteria bacterium]|nr:pyridoxal-phosphate dependent enzyme [Candidatus Peregrinibacteria bacterium]
MRHDESDKPELAIYSCGNAAFGASAVARAADYPLSVFVPEGVAPNVLKALLDNRARVNMCVSRDFLSAVQASPSAITFETTRQFPALVDVRNLRRKVGTALTLHQNPEPRVGDPTYLKFKEAMQRGALPISCSGPDNWSAINGGETLAFECVTQLRREAKQLDSVVIQVGGGALASSAIQAYKALEERGMGAMPKIHVMQTKGGFPLVRAYYLLLQAIAKENDIPCSLKDPQGCSDEEFAAAVYAYSQSDKHASEKAAIIEFASKYFGFENIQAVLKGAVEHPTQFMKPWHEEPQSKAHGILDDVTYDWFEIVKALLKTGGRAVIVDENNLEEAHRLVARNTDIEADHTGTSGLAGLLALRRNNVVLPREKVGVFITGKERHQEAA